MDAYEAIKAAKGKYRVLSIDKFRPPGEGHKIFDEFDTADEALFIARVMTRYHQRFASGSSIALVFYAYDDTGEYLGGDVWEEGWNSSWFKRMARKFADKYDFKEEEIEGGVKSMGPGGA